MAMEEILDSVRRIVKKWVSTASRIQADINRGDTTVCVKNPRRFNVGDQVMLKNNTVYETGLTVSEINVLAGSENTSAIANTIVLSTPILNDWTMAENTVLIKTIEEQFVQGIYIGEPDVIQRYPAITVNGISKSSEWFTLETTKERYEVEIGVYVQASTHEKGYRFLLNIVDAIQLGLKRNIVPLVNDYDITSLVEDISAGDVDIKITDKTLVEETYRRILIEDEYESHENWVTYGYSEEDDPAQQQVRLRDCVPFDYDKDSTSIIVPKRFVFNSWPSSIQYGTIHKGELLKAAKISWFAEEEELQHIRRDELKLS